MDKLEWELALLLNGRADAAFAHDWGRCREYDRQIADKQEDIRVYQFKIDNLAQDLFSKVNMARA
jgi:hypothetical protein